MPLFYWVLWIVLSGEITVGSCVMGAVASAALTAFTAKIMGYRLRRRGAAALWKRGVYLLVLVKEIILAAVRITIMVWRPHLALRPELIHFTCGLERTEDQALLADSITLTAGTITVSAEDGRFCVHTLDRSLADGIESCGFVRRLAEIEALEGKAEVKE